MPSVFHDPVAEPRRQKNKRAHYSADLSAPCVARARASAPIVSAVASGLLAKTRSALRGRRPQQQHHHQRSPRTPELHRRPQPDSLISTAQPSTSPSCGQQPLHRPGGSSRSVRSQVALIAGRSADRRRCSARPSRARARGFGAIKVNNAPKPLIFQCRGLALRPVAAGARRRPHDRSPRTPELHRSPRTEFL